MGPRILTQTDREERSPKALETQEELLVALVLFQAQDDSPCNEDNDADQG